MDFDGKGFGTPEAFRDKCIIEAAPGATAIAQQAQLAHSYCGTTQVLTSYFEIMEYAGKPANITSYDAAQTLQMIKNDGRIKEYTSPDILDVGLMGYMTWWGSKRSSFRVR